MDNCCQIRLTSIYPLHHLFRHSPFEFLLHVFSPNHHHQPFAYLDLTTPPLVNHPHNYPAQSESVNCQLFILTLGLVLSESRGKQKKRMNKSEWPGILCSTCRNQVLWVKMFEWVARAMHYLRSPRYPPARFLDLTQSRASPT